MRPALFLVQWYCEVLLVWKQLNGFHNPPPQIILNGRYEVYKFQCAGVESL
jgi:hypothetical protein